MSWRIIEGDALVCLRGLDDASVQTCITSPPYFGLRDYGHDGQMGLEATPAAYVAALVAVFAGVRRVLRDDGTLWLNLGDSYAGSWGAQSRGGPPSGSSTLRGNGHVGGGPKAGSISAVQIAEHPRGTGSIPAGADYKAKDLIGIPWMVAFALRAEGWYLRSEIIWHKPNPMPESVRDRPTRAHEQVFLFAKGQWKSRVVQFADLPSERFHLLDYLGSENPRLGPIPKFCVRHASAILDRAEEQDGFSLPSLDSEVWKQGADGLDSDFVRGLPVEHWPAVWAARFLSADASTKEFLQEMDRLRVTLPDGGDLLVGGSAAGELPLPPGVTRYGEAAIAIHDAGQVCKIDFASHTVELRHPTGCSYFYDADAVREEGNSFGRQRSLRTDKIERAAEHIGREWHGPPEDRYDIPGRNKRSVWSVATQPYAEAHFATFPPKLIEPMVLAGAPVGGLVLDPFAGAGTTGVVATRLDRSFVGVELNPAYREMARNRIRDDQPLFNQVSEAV